jgi:hypothetical protein
MANVRHAWLDKCAVRAMRKLIKLSFNSDESGRKKCKRDHGVAYSWDWWNLSSQESGVGRSVFVGAFGVYLASTIVKNISLLI